MKVVKWCGIDVVLSLSNVGDSSKMEMGVSLEEGDYRNETGESNREFLFFQKTNWFGMKR